MKKKEGRPLLYGSPVIKKTVGLEQAVIDFLKTKDNVSQFVNKVLRAEMEKEHGQLPVPKE